VLLAAGALAVTAVALSACSSPTPAPTSGADSATIAFTVAAQMKEDVVADVPDLHFGLCGAFDLDKTSATSSVTPTNASTSAFSVVVSANYAATDDSSGETLVRLVRWRVVVAPTGRIGEQTITTTKASGTVEDNCPQTMGGVPTLQVNVGRRQ